MLTVSGFIFIIFIICPFNYLAVYIIKGLLGFFCTGRPAVICDHYKIIFILAKRSFITKS